MPNASSPCAFAPAGPALLLGSAGGNRVELAGLDLALALDVRGTDLELKAAVAPRGLVVVVTGKGLSDLIREEFGFRATFFLMLALVVTNFGNIVAEFAGVASSLAIKAHFRKLHDPRRRHGREHLFLDILVIAICAVIGNADSWRAIALWGRTHEKWLRWFLTLPNGIPCHDTFRRLFERLLILD